MKIGDKVTFMDRMYANKRRVGIIKKMNEDGSKAMVSVAGKFSKEWIKIEYLTVVTE